MVAPPVVLLLGLVLLAEPPASSPANRLLTFRVLTSDNVVTVWRKPAGLLMPQRVGSPTTVGNESDEYSGEDEAPACSPGAETDPCDAAQS